MTMYSLVYLFILQSLPQHIVALRGLLLWNVNRKCSSFLSGRPLVYSPRLEAAVIESF